MAITFEQKQGVSESLVPAIIVIILLVAIGFFVWKIYWQEPVTVDNSVVNKVSINRQILNDERIVNLELFPQIPPAEEANIGRKIHLPRWIVQRAPKK